MDRPYASLPCNLDEASLKEKLEAAYSNINFLQQEHATTIKGLHEEIEKLQNMHRELEFRLEVENQLENRDATRHKNMADIEEKIGLLTKENDVLKRKLYDSSHTIAILDQKQKLLKWQHHQELEERESTIMRLQKELETKCSTVAQLTSHLQRKKRANFLRRFSFNSESSAPIIPKVSRDHCGSRKDLERQTKSLPFYESEFYYRHGNSSNSSFSDRSASDDDSISRRSIKNDTTLRSRGRCMSYESSQSSELKLPPINFPPGASQRQLVRQQIRVDKMASKVTPDTLAIDQISSPEMAAKRLNKAL